MTLNADGSVSMDLDCNRATGTWTVEFAEGGDNGSLSLGPLAGTRALCPPPSMDERITNDAQWVRGFLLRDGNLYLSLMAVGGIYAWEPALDAARGSGFAVPFEVESDPAIEAAIFDAASDETREIADISDREVRYVYSRFDLENDGTEEVLVYMPGSIFSGTGGCAL
jgi:hypothetical protein